MGAGPMSSRLEFSLARDGLEQDPKSGERLDGVIPDPLNLRACELPHHPSEQGGELGGEEDQPGRKRSVDALRGIHALDILRVAHDPVEMAETAKQQAVVKGRVKVDDRELARTIDGEQIDLAARVTRDLDVDRATALIDWSEPVQR